MTTYNNADDVPLDLSTLYDTDGAMWEVSDTGQWFLSGWDRGGPEVTLPSLIRAYGPMSDIEVPTRTEVSEARELLEELGYTVTPPARADGWYVVRDEEQGYLGCLRSVRGQWLDCFDSVTPRNDTVVRYLGPLKEDER